jgi:alkylated DNA repair dioxygenase AlkB
MRRQNTCSLPGAILGPVLQLSLLASAAEPSVDPHLRGLTRTDLGRGAWLDVVPGWVGGADALFDLVHGSAPWRAHQRVMWDQLVDEPRLSTSSWADAPPVAHELAAALSRHYDLDLSAISANLYRDGRDSVAWHGDTLGRQVESTIVAIVSLGAPRRFLLRPKGGGPSRRLVPAHGDLLVLGGTCQRTFDHAVPKMAHAGPRISLMFREPGVF